MSTSDEIRRQCDAEVEGFLELYGASDACAAYLLCDFHPADALAYTIVGPDLSTTNLTYGDLKEQSKRVAAGLTELGIGRGDRVATLMGKSADYLVALLAIWRIGAVHVPLFTAFAPAAIAFRLRGSRARLVICDEPQRSKLLPSEDMPESAPWQVVTTGPAERGAISFSSLAAVGSCLRAPAVAVGGEGALIHIYTSGTTGAPKGVVHTLRMLAAVRAYMRFGLDLRSEDFYWCAADPGWAYGLYYGILGPLSTGVPSILLQGAFSPATTMAALERFGVTNFAAAPTVFRAIRAAELPSPQTLTLRCLSSAGEPLTSDINDWARATLGVPIHDHYGQTETGMVINNHHDPRLREPLVPGSMGRAMPGFDVTLLAVDSDNEAETGSVGRVAIDLAKSALAWFRGYDGDAGRTAEKFTADGRYYLTGDIASVDADGHYHFSSRDDDVIIMAGYRIGPSELEAVIESHPAIRECAVIAVPDAIRGEVVEAYVALAEPAAGADDLELKVQSWVKSRYAAHAFPRAVHVIDALPRTPSGKLQRAVLRQQRCRERSQ